MAFDNTQTTKRLWLNTYSFNYRSIAVLKCVNRLDAALHFLYVLQRLNCAKFYSFAIYPSSGPVVLGFLSKFKDTKTAQTVIANAYIYI